MKDIDRIIAIFEQLNAMKAKMDESPQVGLLVASINVHEMRPMAAAIKNLADEDLNWDAVAKRLIKEFRGLKKTN